MVSFDLDFYVDPIYLFSKTDSIQELVKRFLDLTLGQSECNAFMDRILRHISEFDMTDLIEYQRSINGAEGARGDMVKHNIIELLTKIKSIDDDFIKTYFAEIKENEVVFNGLKDDELWYSVPLEFDLCKFYKNKIR